MITFDKVSKRYGPNHEALTEVSFEIGAGEMVFVTGHSGAGKSTLLKLIGLVERPTRGQIAVNHRQLARVKRRGIPEVRRGIGMVFQDHRLLTDRTVFDNIALPLIIAGTTREEIGKRVRAALDQVGLLGREQSVPLELSTGEQQRVGIARAVVSKPPVLIADEPTGNLDPELSVEVMNIFRRFNEVGVTVLVASHDLHLLEHFPVRRVRLEGGRVVDDMPAGVSAGEKLVDPAKLITGAEGAAR